jgi:lysine-specific permease
VNALIATTLVAMLCFLTSLFGDQAVYMWLMSASGMSGFIAWLGIAICHYRFRKGYLLQGGELHHLPYRALFFPFGPLLAFLLCLLVTLGQDYTAFTADTIDWKGAAATYIGIPIFFMLWLGYKLKNKTSFVRYQDMQFPQKD